MPVVIVTVGRRRLRVKMSPRLYQAILRSEKSLTRAIAIAKRKRRK